MTTQGAATIDGLARRSIAIIRAGQAPSGAWIAAPTFATYRFSWFRDGAFIADAMSRVGDIDAAERFFTWCAGILVQRRERIEAIVEATGAGRPGPAYLHTRYHADGTESDADWENHQLDGYGTWLWALDAHARRHGRSVRPYLAGVALSAEYIAALHRLPCYDWWEEHGDERHPSTLAAVAAGLRAVSCWSELDMVLRDRAAEAVRDIEATIRNDASRLGHVAKWIGGESVDASLVSVATPFGLLPATDPLMRATVERVERDLVHAGGVHRYLDDVYYGGGEWPILSALLGWHRLRTGQRDAARAHLDWMMGRATTEGELPEQVADHLLAPTMLQPWVDRWGPSACPLLWSHAMFLTLARELGLVAADLAVVVAA